MRALAFVLAASLSAVAAQAEWFDRGKAAYRTPDGKWRKAAINVEKGKVEVLNRKDRTVVAGFTRGSIEHGVEGRRRGREAAAVGGLGAGILLGAFLVAKQDEGEVVVRDGQASTKEISGKRVGIVAAVIVGITAAVGLTKAKEPYTEITDGARSVRLRVSKGDLARFESSLRGSLEE